MKLERGSREGLFAGTDLAICHALGLDDAKQLKWRTTYRELSRRPVAVDVLVDLTKHLYRLISSNLGERTPSIENWRWMPQAKIHPGNRSPEVILERSIALLVERKHLKGWCNQIPVASGLVDSRSDRRAAVDLASITGDRLDLYELKWKSDTPIYAAFEILRYGLAYLLCRKNPAYASLETMKVEALGLNVLAPPSYYGFDLSWLQAGLDAGIRTVAQEQPTGDFRAFFRFLVIRATPFGSGAEAMAACGAAPLGLAGEALVQAMSELTPVYPPLPDPAEADELAL
jgi:hypothetical protein